MRVAIIGATGFVGRHLIEVLQDAGHDPVALVRNLERGEDVLGTDIEMRQYESLDAASVRAAVAGTDAIINLAGENIFGDRWNKRYMEALRQSRIDTTNVLYDAVHGMPLEERPKVLVSGSAVGIYGDRPANDPCFEDAFDAVTFKPADFLANLCKGWEHAARRLELLGLRVARARIGVVLERGGGALEQMERAFKAFVGGPVTLRGKQIVSWVHRTDLCRALVFALENESLNRAFNATAPAPVSMKEFAQALGRAMRRPSFAALPGPMARILFGKGRARVLTTGQYVPPKRLEDAGFQFKFATIDAAMRGIYESPAAAPVGSSS